MNGYGHGRFRVLGLALVATLALTGFGQANAARATGKTPKPKVVKGAGDIGARVAEFRALLGADNGGSPTQYPSGRREINWDGVPDEFAAPNALPPDFFNATAEPRARGAVLETPGDNVSVSAKEGNPAGVAVRFGNINFSYADRFRTFSAERLFSPTGSNVVNLRFNVPGTTAEAAVRGFGAVYTSVDRKESAAFQYFDKRGKSLGKFAVPVSKNGLSFLGVQFADPVVARVKIVYGNNKLGPDDRGKYDVAVMDDFIYGEPQALTG
jgi:hypothetical protein